MTNPVQIQRYDADMRDDDRGSFYGTYPCLSECVNGEVVKYADHQAALLKVREMLEAKAKEWDEQAEKGYDPCNTSGSHYAHAKSQDASTLRALAATLGNQGK